MKLTNAYREKLSKVVFKKEGRVVGYQIDEVRLPDGKKATREFMMHPGAVGALAFASKNEILLVKQYRHPVRQFTYEIPAGKLGKGENPLACIKRELEEVTGYRAGKIRKTVHVWPTAAFSDEVIHLYVATDLKETRMNPDDDEFLELVRVTQKQMERLIQTGKIHDSKTLIAYLGWKSGVL